MTDLAQLLDRYMNGCLADPARILQSSRLEQETSRSYSGREVLELTQNAIDAIEPGGTIVLALNDDVLTVHNSGKPFDTLGVEALIYGSMSSKFDDNSQIGSKGLGLRSLLNVSSNFKIYSGDFNVEFSVEASKRFMELLREYPTVQEYERDFHILETSVFGSPLAIDTKYSEWACTIEIKLLPNMVNIVKKELEELSADSAMIISASDKIGTLNINGAVQTKANVEDKNTICWNADKDVCLVLPKDVKQDIGSRVWYTYFPTKDRLPLNGLIHAKFELDSTRNHIINTQDNARLKRKALNFYIDTVVEMTSEANKFERYHRLYPGNEMTIDDYNYKVVDLLPGNDNKLHRIGKLHKVTGAFNELLPGYTLLDEPDNSIVSPDLLITSSEEMRVTVNRILTDANRAKLCKSWTDNYRMSASHPDFLKGCTKVGPNILEDRDMMPDWLKTVLMKEYGIENEDALVNTFYSWGLRKASITHILDNAVITSRNVEQAVKLAHANGYTHNMKFMTAGGSIREASECYLNMDWSGYNIVKYPDIPDGYYISCGCNTKLKIRSERYRGFSGTYLPLDWQNLLKQPAKIVCRLLLDVEYKRCEDGLHPNPIKTEAWYNGKPPKGVDPIEIEDAEVFKLLSFFGMRQLTVEDIPRIQARDLERQQEQIRQVTRDQVWQEFEDMFGISPSTWDAREEAAKAAEQEVKAYPESKYGNIKWYSRVLPGHTLYDHYGYDATYEDEHGQTHYVEIKSAKDKAFISAHEIDVLATHGKNAHIYFVRADRSIKVCDFAERPEND